MTAAEYRAALDRYEAALRELREARNNLAAAEHELRDTIIEMAVAR